MTHCWLCCKSFPGVSDMMQVQVQMLTEHFEQIKQIRRAWKAIGVATQRPFKLGFSGEAVQRRSTTPSWYIKKRRSRQGGMKNSEVNTKVAAVEVHNTPSYGSPALVLHKKFPPHISGRTWVPFFPLPLSFHFSNYTYFLGASSSLSLSSNYLALVKRRKRGISSLRPPFFVIHENQ
ncbi:hypothetical protein K505DRAFT_140022 [Melanomma pulvis-pyrius CBS 109.77]|uniref:Uncharacterized protein n=1 Tax=Melanomma pulvis-pyrius CBS 109.77 TaxID=1314802 RepID=A0A6A6WSE0_9PLEO|nr:hypothetical protein K505DRAFT_140022 [Melanomma pulvis-pyrius CBS 109.77]